MGRPFSHADNDIVVAVLNDWKSNVAKEIRPGVCILASATITEALTYFGVPAVPVAADVTFFNAVAWKLFDAAVPTPEWPPEAWSVGCSHATPMGGAAKGYNGHVVVVLGDHEILVDATSKQFNRPSRDLKVPDRIVAPLLANDPDRTYVQSNVTGVVGAYQLRPEQRGWKHTPDYRGRKREAASIIRRVRETIGGS